MDNLEGGVDYLREVIVDNKLGINDQLETDIAGLVGNFVCEWTDTINDEAQLSASHISSMLMTAMKTCL